MSTEFLLQYLALSRVAAVLETLTPEDVEMISRSPALPKDVIVMGVVPYHLKALHLVWDRAVWAFQEADIVYRRMPAGEKTAAELHKVRKLHDEQDGLKGLFEFAFKMEFPIQGAPNDCIEAIPGIGPHDEAFYELRRANPAQLFEEAVEEKEKGPPGRLH